jgi:hypothetical protein
MSSDFPPPPPPPPPPSENIPPSAEPHQAVAVSETDGGNPPLSGIGKRGKRIIAGIVLGLVLLFTGSAIYHRITGSPPEKLLLAEIVRSANAAGWSFTEVRRVETRALNSASGQLTAQARLDEALYTPADTAKYLQEELGVNLAEERIGRDYLTSAEGKKVLELARIKDLPPDPFTTILLKQTSAPGKQGSYSGFYNASKESGVWSISLSGSLEKGAASGQARGSYPKDALIDTEPATQTILKARYEAAAQVQAKIIAAREQFHEQLRRDREAKLEVLRGLMKAGAFFVGTAEQRYNHQTTPISLEFIGADSGKGALQVLLRNDGGWQDTRGFQGNWKADPEVAKALISLRTLSNQAIRDGGPILDNNDTWTVNLVLDANGTLEGNTDGYLYHFTRVADAEAEAVKNEAQQQMRSLLDTIAPGSAFIGAVVSKRDNSSEQVLLRINRVENNGVLLAASLESIDRSNWKRALAGTIIGNRYRSENHPVRLKRSGDDAVKRAPDGSVFSVPYDAQLMFSLDGETLRGDDGNYRYELKHASASDLAELQAKHAARTGRFSAAVRTGATYDGTARNSDGFVGRVRLRFTAVDLAHDTVALVVESRDQVGIHTDLKGAPVPEEGLLSLRTGAGSYNSSGVLRVPFFSQDAVFRLQFHLGEESIDGTIENYSGWKLEFPLKKQVETSVPAYPTTSGAYVLIGDKWEPLPTNGGHAGQSTSSVLGQAGSLLRALNDVSKEETNNAKLAELIFDGTDPVPTVKGDAVVIVYVGAIDPPTAKLLKKYPALRDYPTIELAPSTTKSNGSRFVDLLRIVPGVAGFVDQRVAASVDTVADNVTVLTCTGTLESGRYALSVSSLPASSYELQVK